MVLVRRLALVALFAFACGAAPAHAQSLALAYHSGAAYKYKFHSTANETTDIGGTTVPVTLDMTASETVTVKSVDSSGNADLSIGLSNMTMKTSANGITNTTTGMPSPTVDIKIGADGRILSVNGSTMVGGSPFSSFSGMSGGFVSAVLPDTAVKPGDTWSKDYDQSNPLGSGSIHITTKSKYLRDESLQSINAAVVETTSTGSIDISIDMSKIGGATGGTAIPPGGPKGMTIKGTMASDVTTWIDPSGHRVLKTHMTGSTTAAMTIDLPAGTTTPGVTGPFSIKGAETTDLTPG
jgi:hypothetical protein